MAKLLLLFCVVLPPAAFGHPLQFSSHPVTTVIQEDRPARFVVIGDFGTKEYGPEDRHEIVARVMREYHQRKAWDFGITVGDNFYPRGLNSENHVRWRRDWEDVYGPLGICFYPTLGNHDWRSGPEAQLNYTSSSWSMPGTYYTLRAGPMQLFALDTPRIWPRNQNSSNGWRKNWERAGLPGRLSMRTTPCTRQDGTGLRSAGVTCCCRCWIGMQFRFTFPGTSTTSSTWKKPVATILWWEVRARNPAGSGPDRAPDLAVAPMASASSTRPTPVSK